MLKKIHISTIFLKNFNVNTQYLHFYNNKIEENTKFKELTFEGVLPPKPRKLLKLDLNHIIYMFKLCEPPLVLKTHCLRLYTVNLVSNPNTMYL